MIGLSGGLPGTEGVHAVLIVNPIRAVRLSAASPGHACALGWNNVESAFEAYWQKGFHVYISHP